MNKIFQLFILSAFLLGTVPAWAMGKDVKTVKGLAKRLIPEFADDFVFESKNASDSVDFYELESLNGKIHIRGNNANSMAVGLNRYLNDFCKTTVSWYVHDAVKMPRNLPVIPQKIEVNSTCPKRFFLNYCTFGYTMPWWGWNEWERFIDWMALQGVNMPLAITGQEAIWYNVWRKFGLSDTEIRSYFTGPAHLPWHRMSNLDRWDGPLPHSWLDHQLMLQKKIVERERLLNMTPVLPAFAGHVPPSLKDKYPQSQISRLSSWGGFSDDYRSYFLDPMDSLFVVIQKEFLNEQTKQFGTDHIYGADPFNEVMPPSWEPSFLAKVSDVIYRSISAIDPDAVWLQMTWLFYIDRELWTNERIKAFLNAVPRNKMLLLDYYCENTEVWKQTEGYFGQPYIWCYLGNFGGNTMLAGNIKEVNHRIDNTFRNGGANFVGLGSTLEAFDMNPHMYEYLFSKAWNHSVPDSVWIKSLACRHLGSNSRWNNQAWQLLYDSIYTSPAKLGQGTLTNSRPSFAGHSTWTNPQIKYDNKTLLKAWGLLLRQDESGSDIFDFDVVNLGRQVLGNYFTRLYADLKQAYTDKDEARCVQVGHQMLEILQDMDALLATHETFLLGNWIEDARKIGKSNADKEYYEQNARTLITTWGDRDQSLNDYANRSWAGLTADYYYPRWKSFIDAVTLALQNDTPFDEKKFRAQVTQFEKDWTRQRSKYATTARGNSLETAKSLYKKYARLIE